MLQDLLSHGFWEGPSTNHYHHQATTDIHTHAAQQNTSRGPASDVRKLAQMPRTRVQTAEPCLPNDAHNNVPYNTHTAALYIIFWATRQRTHSISVHLYSCMTTYNSGTSYWRGCATLHTMYTGYDSTVHSKGHNAHIGGPKLHLDHRLLSKKDNNLVS